MEQHHPRGNQFQQCRTPSHIVELFKLKLQDIFADTPDDYPWKFLPNDNTKICFDLEHNKDSRVYGKKPCIIFSRGDLNASPIVLGDRVALSMSSGAGAGTTLINSSMQIKVLGRKLSEVDILSNEIFHFLVASRTSLREWTYITTVNNMALSPINPYDTGDHNYYCVISMAYTMQYQWNYTIDAPLLAGGTITTNGESVYDK